MLWKPSSRFSPPGRRFRQATIESFVSRSASTLQDVERIGVQVIHRSLPVRSLGVPFLFAETQDLLRAGVVLERSGDA